MWFFILDVAKDLCLVSKTLLVYADNQEKSTPGVNDFS